MKYVIMSVCAVLSVVFSVAVNAAEADNSSETAAFNGILRVDLGMNSEQVVATYGQAFVLPCNPDEPVLEINWDKTDQGSRFFHRLMAVTDEPHIPGKPGDYDFMLLIDEQLMSFNMVRWGDVELFDAFVQYFSDDLALGEPMSDQPDNTGVNYGFPYLSDNGAGAYWLDANSGDALYVQFDPGNTDETRNVTVGLSRPEEYLQAIQ